MKKMKQLEYTLEMTQFLWQLWIIMVGKASGDSAFLIPTYLCIVVQVLFEKTRLTLSEDDGEFRVCTVLQTFHPYPIESSITIKLTFPSLLLIVVSNTLNWILSRWKRRWFLFCWCKYSYFCWGNS